MNKNNFDTMDFDSMLAVAKERPEDFERLRLAAIDEFIESAPEERRQRLRCLQWRIDQERRNRTPLSACLHISRMMWEQLHGEFGLLAKISGLKDKPWTETTEEPCSAKVIDFRASGGH